MVFQGPFYRSFYHPFMQNINLNLGQCFVLIVFFILKYRNRQFYEERRKKAKQQGKIVDFNRLVILVPAIADLLTSTLVLVALNFVSGSVTQMLRGGSLVSTFLLSIFLLKMKPSRVQIVSTLIVLVGIIIVGASQLIFSSTNDTELSAGLEVMGYTLLMFYFFIDGFLVTTQQKLFRKYHIEPLEMVGYEGIYGFVIQIFLIAIYNYLPCPFGLHSCVINESGMPYIESTRSFFTETFQNPALLVSMILAWFTVAIYTITGASITKYINAISRAICDISRTLTIWIVGIIMTVTLGKTNPEFEWQKTQPLLLVMKGLGFLLVVYGNLLYNGLIAVKCLKQVQKTQLTTGFDTAKYSEFKNQYSESQDLFT